MRKCENKTRNQAVKANEDWSVDLREISYSKLYILTAESEKFMSSRRDL